MRAKKVLSVVLSAAMLLGICVGLTACGSGGSDGSLSSVSEPGAEVKMTEYKSTNGIISIKATENYVPEISSYYERVKLWQKGMQSQNTHFIDIETADPEGEVMEASTVCQSYKAGEAYTLDAMKKDLDEYIVKYPNIYHDPADAKVNGVDFIRTEVTTNGVDSYKYFGVVDGKPVIITVCDDRDSDEVKSMLETLVVKFEKQ